MVRNPLVRLYREDEGLQVVEWALVGVICALAYALLQSHSNADLRAALYQVTSCVSSSVSC
jgi:hypothetical protein